jgi:hypothetical protein
MWHGECTGSTMEPGSTTIFPRPAAPQGTQVLARHTGPAGPRQGSSRTRSPEDSSYQKEPHP